MDGPEPKYKEVEREMRQLAATLPAGARIPPERHLAITYNCNFLTVRKALKSLVDEGIIVRRVGSGTFVAENGRNGAIAPGGPGRIPGRRPRHVGLLVYHKSNPYAYRLLQSIAHAAMEENISLRSSWVGDFNEDARRQVQNLIKDGCSTIVLPWFPHHLSEEIRKFVKECPIPVIMPMLISGLEANYFGHPEKFGDDLVSCIEAICHYHTLLGRKSLAFLGTANAEDPILQKMLAGYTYFVSAHRQTNLATLVDTKHAATDEIAERWREYRGELGVVCYDDQHALRLMTSMHKLGLSAPKDFGVIGFNNTEASSYSDPPLTTVSQDFLLTGRQLLDCAMARAEGGAFEPEERPKKRLMIRSSCGGQGQVTDKLRKELDTVVLVEDAEPTPLMPHHG